MSYLVLVRHGMSEYNEKGLWTGWDNPPLTATGEEQAQKAGECLKDLHFDYAYSSALIRAKQTLILILHTINQESIPVTESEKLNERNYGDYTAKNKWQIKELLGEAEFNKLRRGWDYPIPNGESLKQVYEREIPYFESEILPQLKNGKNVIIASSGNAMRAIIKYLEQVPDDQIASIELGVGEVLLYSIDEDGSVSAKERRNTSTVKV